VGVEKMGAVNESALEKFGQVQQSILDRAQAIGIVFTCYGLVLYHWVVFGPWWQLREPKAARKLSAVIRYLAKTIKE
jgi:hypothetical protein